MKLNRLEMERGRRRLCDTLRQKREREKETAINSPKHLAVALKAWHCFSNDCASNETD